MDRPLRRRRRRRLPVELSRLTPCVGHQLACRPEKANQTRADVRSWVNVWALDLLCVVVHNAVSTAARGRSRDCIARVVPDSKVGIVLQSRAG